MSAVFLSSRVQLEEPGRKGFRGRFSCVAVYLQNPYFSKVYHIVWGTFGTRDLGAFPNRNQSNKNSKENTKNYLSLYWAETTEQQRSPGSSTNTEFLSINYTAKEKKGDKILQS